MQVLAEPHVAYQLDLMGSALLKIEIPGVGDRARASGVLAKLNAERMGWPTYPEREQEIGDVEPENAP